MEPEPDRIDLSVLDPSRHAPRWDAAVGKVAARALELRRLRRAVMRRGMAALVLSAAAALVLWFVVPRREARPSNQVEPQRVDMLDWATRQGDVLELGGGDHAQ